MAFRFLTKFGLSPSAACQFLIKSRPSLEGSGRLIVSLTSVHPRLGTLHHVEHLTKVYEAMMSEPTVWLQERAAWEN